MKGFAKIFEAIIASVVLLASLTFFFVPNVQKSGWDDAALQTLAEDVLQSTYLNGSLVRYIKTDNTTPLNIIISDMLPKTVDFSLEVIGIPNNIIYVSCVDCTNSQINEIKLIMNMTDFMYKNRNISVRVQNLSLGMTTVPDDTDILFFFDKTKIATYQNQTDSFLEGRGSIFLLSDLTSGDVNGVIGSMFNLTWSGSSSQPGSFNDVYNSTKLSHFVARYYANISGKNLADIEGETFVAFDSSGVRAENDEKDMIRTGDARLYSRGRQTKGRTLWFSDYNRADHENNTNTKSIDRLLKASLMWASGERFDLDLTKKTPAPVHFKSSIFVYDGDTYVVELTIWRIFF